MGFRVNSGTTRPEPITFKFNGAAIEAYPGETVAAALIASDIRAFRRDLGGRLRGPYCNMGTCFDCVLEMRAEEPAGAESARHPEGFWRTVRACLTQVRVGLEVRSREAPGSKDPGT